MVPAFLEVSKNYFSGGTDSSNEAHTALASPSEGAPGAPPGHYVPGAQLDEPGWATRADSLAVAAVEELALTQFLGVTSSQPFCDHTNLVLGVAIFQRHLISALLAVPLHFLLSP